MTKSKHTATPWQLQIYDMSEKKIGTNIATIATVSAEGKKIFSFEGMAGADHEMQERNLNLRETKRANAAFIVKAVNNHEPLVKALTGLYASVTKGDDPIINACLDNAFKALAAAKGDA